MKHFFTLLSLLGIIFSFHPKPSYAQKEFYNWYFGDSAGVSYMTGSPVVFLSSKMWAPSGGSCNISDSLGSILFYSDFINVYNRHNVVMPNGWLNGSMASMSFVKQTIAFRQLNDHSKYFIFYTGLVRSHPGCSRY